MKSTKGFTLIELIMVIVLTSIVASMIGLLLKEAAISYMNGKPLITVAVKGNIGIDNLLRELKAARNITAVGTNNISFVNQNNQSVVITLSGTTVLRNVASLGAQTLIPNVTSIKFTYYDSTLNSTTATPANVRFVTVDVTLTESAATYSFIGGTVIRKLL